MKWNKRNTPKAICLFFPSSGKYTLNVCVVFFHYSIYWTRECETSATVQCVARRLNSSRDLFAHTIAFSLLLPLLLQHFENLCCGLNVEKYIYIVSPVQAVECGGCTDDDDDFSSSQVSSYSHSLIFSNRIELRRCHSFMSWMLEHETDIVPLTCFYFVPIFSNFAATAAAAAHIGRCHWYVFGICSPFACTYCTRHKIIARFVCLY